ncbi:MAG: sel1 repeat family protein [Prevotella sp.]|nr:sel1 repeat family protein [Prevotella sp.]
MRRIVFMILALVATVAVSAQNADKLYEQGKALYDSKNYTKAFPMLKTAAEKGHKKAQYRIGRCYDKGRGVTEDNQQAFQWYSKAASQGHAKSQYQVGKCYLKGKGVSADKQKAKTWLNKAVKNAKGGDKVMDGIKQDAAKGDEDCKAMLNLLGK